MFARVFTGVWQENVDATQHAWQRLKAVASAGASVAGPSIAGHSSDQARLHKRWQRKLLGGATAAIAVLALTYSAATAFVTGAAGSSAARSDYLAVLQAASAEYRRARAECLALAFERRDPCIAEAHATEGKMRAAATTAPRKQLSQMRQTSDQLLLAARGLDSIVIEPACNVVARGNANVCDIQVRGSTVEGPEPLASPRTVAVAAVALVPAVARGVLHGRPSNAHLVSVSGRERSHYFGNVAGLVSP